MNIKISYKIESLIYESAVIALVREIGGAIGVRMGINKVQVETQSRQNIHEWRAHGCRVGGRQETRLYYKLSRTGFPT